MDLKNKENATLGMTPDERLRTTTKLATNVEIDVNIPPRRYYRSGVEMVKMANVYMEEGSLENAYILYLKFMTLFLEKIRAHPEYDSVPASIKAINTQKLREVLPKAEKLKKELLAQYKIEHEKYIVKKRLEEEESERRRLEQERRRLENAKKPPPPMAPIDNFLDHSLKTSVFPVPPLLDNLNYPDIAGNNEVSTASNVILPRPKSVSPEVDRSSKPSQSIIDSSMKIHKTLRDVNVPDNLMRKFLSMATWNTDRNIETCGILAGKLRHNEFVITHLLVPEQTGTADSCTTQKEEDIFDFQDQHDLITIGWIHTHPSQTAFLSSVDLHTHYSYQRMLPEAIAIVCAPRYNESKSFCLTPNYGLSFIGSCQKTGFHPHPSEIPVFMESEHSKIVSGSSLEVVDLRK